MGANTTPQQGQGHKRRWMMWQWAHEEADEGLGHGSRKGGPTREGGRLNSSLVFSKLNKHVIMILFHCLCINILLK